MAAAEWTPAIGLQRAIVAVGIRSLMIAPIWAALVWLAAPGFPWIIAGGAFGLLVIAVVFGVVAAAGLFRSIGEGGSLFVRLVVTLVASPWIVKVSRAAS